MRRLQARRHFCRDSLALSALFTGVGATRARASSSSDPDWELYKSRFLQPDGRIVDTGNNGISHSEGQGYGLFFASTFNDRSAFETIWAWTQGTLKHKDGYLHSWRWTPSAPHITDTNNASDGDLMIAWALRRAAILWGREDYAQQAQAIIKDLGQKCVRKVGSRIVLLPGAKGFDRLKSVVINLSYYNIPALQRAVRLDPSGPWAGLIDSGQQLVQSSRFGLWGLPPDWLSIDRKSERIFPATGFPARFSYDAIRIPLYLKWANFMPVSLTQALYAVSQNYTMNGLPGWIDLKSGERSNYNAPPGFKAVFMFALNGPDALPNLPSIKESSDYYSASLTLQARIAAMEMV